jgi:predicted  nucleic acid-binding Zn ribbon protein
MLDKWNSCWSACDQFYVGGCVKYKIVEELDGHDIVLAETNDLFVAEHELCKLINYGYDAYLMEEE